jgi:hypothetical protein
VERDGSADYTVIQDAVDAAASGDTILIGPGRFNEQQWVTCPGWQDSVRVLVHQYELTIIGSGPETIIGQDVAWNEDQGYHKGIVVSDYWNNHVARIEKLRFENMSNGIYSSFEEAGDNTVLIRDCEFMGNHDAVALIGDGGDVRISGCSFNYMARDGLHIGAFRQSKLVIEHCSFLLLDHHHWPQRHISLNGVQNAHVTDCEFLEGSGAITVADGTNALVERCIMDGQSQLAIYPAVHCTIILDDCQIRNQAGVVYTPSPDSYVLIQRSTIANVSDYTFMIWHAGDIVVHDCDLSGGERGIVWCVERNSCAEIQTLDMTGNYWGTADPDSISDLIRDHHDSDDACYIIDFEPFESESTPVEKKSFGDLKALFR